MFPIQLPQEDGRPDGTVSDDTGNERFVPVSSESENCDQFLSANVNKNTIHKTNTMSTCSTFGQDRT